MTDFCTATDRATPGLERGRLGDWVMRNGLGETGRANSCTAHGEPGMALGDAVDAVEAWFAERGRRPTFQIFDDTPPQVDAELVRRHYVTGAITDILSAPVGDLIGRLPAGPLDTDVHREMPPFLAEAFSTDRSGEMIASGLPTRYVTASSGDEVIGGGMAIIDGDLVGVFGMRTDLDRQGEGAGSAVLRSLLAAGADLGATTAWLQVEASNARAADWYRRLGFVRRSGYRYRSTDVT